MRDLDQFDKPSEYHLKTHGLICKRCLWDSGRIILDVPMATSKRRSMALALAERGLNLNLI